MWSKSMAPNVVLHSDSDLGLSSHPYKALIDAGNSNRFARLPQLRSW